MKIINKLKNIFNISKKNLLKSLTIKRFPDELIPHGNVQFIDYIDYECKKTNFDNAIRLLEIKTYKKSYFTDNSYAETVFNFFKTPSGSILLVYALPYESELKIGVISEAYMKDKYLEATSDYGNTANEGIKPIVTVFDDFAKFEPNDLDVIAKEV